MLTLEQLASLDTQALKKKRKFHQMALYFVWCGVGIAFAATAFRLIADGFLAYETISTAALAFMVSIPVYFQNRRIVAVLRSR